MWPLPPASLPMKVALRIFCFPVFYVRAPHHICVHTAMYVLCALHIFYVLACPASVLPCHVLRNLSAHTVSRVFLGEYGFGRFPICSQEETHRMALLVSAQFIPAGRLSSAVQCVVVGVFFQGGGGRISSTTGHHIPLWLRGRGQNPPSLVALGIVRKASTISMHTGTPVHCLGP